MRKLSGEAKTHADMMSLQPRQVVFSYRFDRVVPGSVELLNVIGGDSVLLQDVEGLVRDGHLRVYGDREEC